MPPCGGDARSQIDHARDVAPLVDAFNVSDGAMAQLRTSPIPLAARIQEATGRETIIHLTTRDRNVLALQAELLGAHLLGIRNVLALTGDPPHLGDHPQAHGVYELWGNELIALIQRLNAGAAHTGGHLAAPTDFRVGTALNLHATDAKALRLLDAKLDAGADFFQTQATYDPEAPRRFLAAHPVDRPVLLGIIPPATPKALDGLAKIPGVVLPEADRRRLKTARDFVTEAATWLERIVASAAPHVGGVHLMPIGQANPVARRLAEALAVLRGQPLAAPRRILNVPHPKE